LRALRELGVWEQVDKHGYSYDSLGLRAPDPNGTLIVELDEMLTGGPDLPATAGMYRPDLARILTDRASRSVCGRGGASPRFPWCRTTGVSSWNSATPPPAGSTWSPARTGCGPGPAGRSVSTCRAGAVEPRPGRDHRRRRPRLPADRRPGGAQALEDALVLTELLRDRDDLGDDLWQSFMDRRFARAAEVVEASLVIGRWMLDGLRGDVPGLMHQVASLVQQRP
jgi:hypothetical protein